MEVGRATHAGGFVIIQNYLHISAVVDFPKGSDTAAKAFAIVDAGPRDNILFLTGIIACPERKAGRQAVGDAAADIAGHVAGVVIAKSHTRHRFKFLAGLARIDVERTDRGITAVKRALGPPQHFNGLNVHRIAKEGANTRHINAVKEGADAGFNTGILGV